MSVDKSGLSQLKNKSTRLHPWVLHLWYALLGVTAIILAVPAIIWLLEQGVEPLQIVYGSVTLTGLGLVTGSKSDAVQTTGLVLVTIITFVWLELYAYGSFAWILLVIALAFVVLAIPRSAYDQLRVFRRK